MTQMRCEYYERVVIEMPSVLSGQDFSPALAEHLAVCPVCGELLADSALSVRLRESLMVVAPNLLAHTVSTRLFSV